MDILYPQTIEDQCVRLTRHYLLTMTFTTEARILQCWYKEFHVMLSLPYSWLLLRLYMWLAIPFSHFCDMYDCLHLQPVFYFL